MDSCQKDEIEKSELDVYSFQLDDTSSETRHLCWKKNFDETEYMTHRQTNKQIIGILHKTSTLKRSDKMKISIHWKQNLLIMHKSASRGNKRIPRIERDQTFFYQTLFDKRFVDQIIAC